MLEVASSQRLSKVPDGARRVDLKPAELECPVSSRLEPSGVGVEVGWGEIESTRASHTVTDQTPGPLAHDFCPSHQPCISVLIRKHFEFSRPPRQDGSPCS